MRLVHNFLTLGLAGSVMFGCGADNSTSANVGGLTTPGGLGGGSAAGGSASGGSAAGSIGGTAAGGAQLGGIQGGSLGPGAIAGGVSTPGGAGGIPGSTSLCEVKSVDFLGDAPDMLIVLDRSLSLSLALPERWTPSKDAVNTITQDYEGLINFGLSTFPSGGSGNPLDIFLDPASACAAGMLDVPIMPRNAMAIGNYLNGIMPTGQTPTGPTLTNALAILGDRTPTLDTRTKPGFVLLVTDGDPSCQIDGSDSAQQQAAALMAVQTLKAASITTYVFGYQIDPNFQSFMNQMAMEGGTGMYRAVENSDQIIAAFRDITKDVVRCEFDLGEVPQDVKKVRIEIDHKTILLNDPNGWTIDGKHVTLQGNACANLKDGHVHDLNADIECEDVVLQ